MRRLTGNSVAIPVVEAVIRAVLDTLDAGPIAKLVQKSLLDEDQVYA